MNVRVLLFAQLADAAGCREFDLELPDDATVADALETLAGAHESIATLRGRIALAVNERYAKHNHILVAGDTLALIPPVSGG